MAGALQNSIVNKDFPLILSEDAKVLPFETLLTDASRTVVMYSGTLLGQVAASKKWVPWTTVTATDGSSIPLGIYVGPDVTAAALAAGDVTNAPILVGDAVIDTNLIVFDKGSTGAGTALTLDTVFTDNAAGSGTATPYFVVRAEVILNLKGIFVTGTQAADLPEN